MEQELDNFITRANSMPLQERLEPTLSAHGARYDEPPVDDDDPLGYGPPPGYARQPAYGPPPGYARRPAYGARPPHREPVQELAVLESPPVLAQPPDHSPRQLIISLSTLVGALVGTAALSATVTVLILRPNVPPVAAPAPLAATASAPALAAAPAPAPAAAPAPSAPPAPMAALVPQQPAPGAPLPPPAPTADPTGRAQPAQPVEPPPFVATARQPELPDEPVIEHPLEDDDPELAPAPVVRRAPSRHRRVRRSGSSSLSRAFADERRSGARSPSWVGGFAE